MPVRSTLRGAVISFQVDSALLTAAKGSRLTNSPWPSRVFTVDSSMATTPRELTLTPDNGGYTISFPDGTRWGPLMRCGQ